jgi:hypothetical protein
MKGPGKVRSNMSVSGKNLCMIKFHVSHMKFKALLNSKNAKTLVKIIGSSPSTEDICW